MRSDRLILTGSYNRDGKQKEEKLGVNDQNGHGEMESEDTKPGGSNHTESKTEKIDTTAPDEQPKSDASNKDNAVEPEARSGTIPSTVLEKGIIYFFFRGRVGIDHPERVSDIARTHLVLRPIPLDAKLGDGPIGDAGNSRLIAVPKKVFPQSGKDRWIAFVEKTNASFSELKKDFLAANDYETKTAGTRHSPAATPVGEGVYAITTTGRESHLAYMLTLPEKLGDVQTDLGLKEKGSWILSTRNPQYSAPANTALPQGPEYSKEVSRSAINCTLCCLSFLSKSTAYLTVISRSSMSSDPFDGWEPCPSISFLTPSSC